MIKPNWNNFQAKFNDNPQDYFEWFCYLLFCKELSQPVGIFRYINQSGIETNPVVIDGEVIGWQAKFYDKSLSTKKSELIGMITKSIKRHPDLTKILFYTNQEWGQGKEENDSKVKRDVEEKAKASGIEIEWRTASFFESPFVVIDNGEMAEHFLSPDRSIFDLLEEKQRHTENVLREIQTSIDFNGNKVEIDRGELLDRLHEDLNQNSILIVSGVGGAGKTAVIKKLHENVKGHFPFYVFKANEFNKDSINDLFEQYNLQDFATAHLEEKHKVVVIDSAEKLLDLPNHDPIKEFLSALLTDNWRIIFTTRNNYLENLIYDLIEIYQIRPTHFDIRLLDQQELTAMAGANEFNLPEDLRLLELIKNPFYLNEYLKFYSENKVDYVSFKEKLWSSIITKTTPDREQCFLSIAFQRANEGQFYVTPACDAQILKSLVEDGILGYETAGHFITHDIYEEWALERKIDTAYIRKANNKDFFDHIGISLPVRRSFRNWVSEKLLLEDPSIRQFLEEIVLGDEIATFWKDEVWISVLLSDHSAAYFELFKEVLLDNDQKLLRRLTFLLRLACKEVNYDLFKQLGIKDLNFLAIKHVWTKPKGVGWKNTIRFIHKNIETIGVEKTHFYIPIIHDWNQNVKKGETTRLASLIALRYYEWIIEKDVYLDGDEEKKILQTILYGAASIKTELERIFEDVLQNKWNKHRDRYHDLMKVILTEMEASPVWSVLPELVLQVAELFWYSPPQEERYRNYNIDIEEEFCIDHTRHDYFPASSYQTPIYWLLKFAPEKSIDFILSFTNKTAECFANSSLAADEVEETEVSIGEGQFIKQYTCDRLWCSYRGTQVSPYLLSSIHMALEKYFLENGKNLDSKILESWLLYLLRNSKSASISSVVTSIVLAYPEKTFNVAKVLFQTKDFFLFDTHRLMFDQHENSSTIPVLSGFGSFNRSNFIHEKDRIDANNKPHRKYSLEQLALRYQVFRDEGTSEEQAEERQRIIWGIFDKYYSQLPEESQETDTDKTWRLFLARMDYRKMKAVKKEIDENTVLTFEPEIDPKLKEHSETTLKKSSEQMKYMPLKLWAGYRRDKDERYKQYEQYENAPQLALAEAKEIVDRFRQGTDESFSLFNHAIPSDVCSTLLMDFFDRLCKEDRGYCKDIILEYAQIPAMPHYRYQISDGTTTAISALPVTFHNFPTERENIKRILLLTLFNDYPVGMGGGSYSAFPTSAIHALWESHFDDMQSLLIGYLMLKPKYEELRKISHQESYIKEPNEIDEEQLIDVFFKKHEHDLDKIIENTIAINDLRDIEQTDLRILNTVFQLIPIKTNDAVHKQLSHSIISIFANRLLSRSREDRVNYSVRCAFLKKLAYLVLNASEQDIPDYLEPFLNGFNGSEPIANLFEQLVLAEDQLGTYDKFWQVWTLFFDKLVALCKDGDGYGYVGRIVKSYLFAQTLWSEAATDWHTFKDGNGRFFADIAQKIGHCPSTLYALAKSLNDVASRFLNPGITWLSGMLFHNKELWTSRLEPDTLYYLENLVRKYINRERERIRKTTQLKKEVLVVLDFLVEKGSVTGYLLRENVL